MTRLREGSLLVDTEENGRIWILTLNRPERLNAFNADIRIGLRESYRAFLADEDAVVLILTGNGRGFCTGQDLKENVERQRARAAGLPDPVPPMPDHLQADFARGPLADSMGLWKPMIAAVNGFAVAGGFDLAIQCDVRIAAESAKFGVTEARWNMASGWVHHLTRIIGLGNALEIVLWGDEELISAQRAYDMGLVNKVVPDDQLMDTARRWAHRQLALGPRCVRNLKEILYCSTYMSPFEIRRFANLLEQNLQGMQDSIEGPRAFVEKRRPVFRNA